jgi:hypothetical protein
MLRFIPNALDQLVCVKENNDGSTTVLATCSDGSYGAGGIPKNWTVSKDQITRHLDAISLTQLIAQAYLANQNVLLFFDLLGKFRVQE